MLLTDSGKKFYKHSLEILSLMEKAVIEAKTDTKEPIRYM